MTHSNTKGLNRNDFLDLLKNLTDEEIQANISLMSNEQQKECLQHIIHPNNLQWNSQLLAVAHGLTEYPALEHMGRFLKAHHFLHLLSHKKEIETPGQHKLSSLLVGVTSPVFNEILSSLNDTEKSLLRQEAGTEPLQHQLTLFSHEMAFQLENFLDRLREMEREIDAIDPTEITCQVLESFYRNIDSLRHVMDEDLVKITNALALSWNSSRSDLIESLSFQKESRQKYRTYVIGLPPSEHQPATGFYARMLAHLNTVFSDPGNAYHIEDLHDNEPAIEALAKFSLWYLQDYMEIGLLEHTATELDMNNSSYTDQERAEYRGALYRKAQNNLAAIGLVSVKDLKDKQIFSKELLKQYIAAKRT